MRFPVFNHIIPDMGISGRAAGLAESLLKDGIAVRMRARGASMEPALPGGSGVTVRPPSPGRPPDSGEVVLVRGPDGGLLLHRLRRRLPGRKVKSGRPVLLTRGDALRQSDPPLPGSALLGVLEGMEGGPYPGKPTRSSRLRHWLAPVLAEGLTPTRAGLEARSAARYIGEAAFLPGAEGLEPWEKAFAGRLPAGGAILDLGCGSGREAMALAAMGFRVTGADTDPGAVAAARIRIPGAAFEACAACDLLDPGLLPGPFDGILMTRGLYSLLPLKRYRTALLAALGRRLAPGGVLALHALEERPRPGPRRLLVGILRAGLQGLFPRRFRWERGDRMLRYVIESGMAGSWVFVHLFAPGEMEAEGRAAGYGAARRLEGGGLALSLFSSQTAAEGFPGKENSQTGTSRTRSPSRPTERSESPGNQ